MKRFLVVFVIASAVADAAPDLEVVKRVDVEVPAPGQPVEFTIDVRNIGSDAAQDVHLQDRLPDALAVPDGMAPFASSGTYDPVTGDWEIGDLAPGIGASLSIPAMIAAPEPPDCIVNTAEAAHGADENAANDRGMAAVRQPGTERCVDVTARFFTVLSTPDCGFRRTLTVVVDIVNQGTDAASNVVATLTQAPLVAPELRFRTTRCTERTCTLATLRPGESVRLLAESDEFANTQPRRVRLTVAASSEESDFAPDNDAATDEHTLPGFSDCAPIDIGDVDSGVAIACFIATAAYGSPLDPHVVALRRFRDEQLMRSGAGRAFVRAYYRYSPAAAELIARHEGLRLAVRSILTPLVLAIAYPRGSLLAALLTVALLAACRRRRGTRAG